MAELSRDDITKICKSFLLSSPPGEFMEVVTDVRGLLNDDALVNELAPSTFKEYNTDQMLAVDSPSGKGQILITKFGEVKPNEYVDPRGGLVLSFDHIEQKVIGSRAISGDLDQDVEPYRAQIDEAVNNYVQEYFQYGAHTVYGSKSGAQHVVTVCISSAKFNPSNFWNGRWRSVWKISFKPGSEVTLEGLLRVNVHYYEDGNVQLSGKVTPKVSCGGGNAGQTANNVIQAIKKAEQDYHAALESTYATMGDTTFKALRRVLPITKNRLDWERIKSEKMQTGK
eukprot:TRINITY_DN1028_c0_g1_i1.p1 TRINITY_DN1028_c0_g1~~TRINITY_DN1028_c0_g1_i1.p1  ORF type:complete len:313 (-),score=80.29 TRINITY_DN1028_c0_g1_i1:126-974(-)